MEHRGFKINVGKTKLLIAGTKHNELPQTGKYPCAVCGRGVGANSILCLTCNKWCHKRCSGFAGSLSAVQNFVCPRCTGIAANIQHTDESIRIECGTIEEVQSFCYLGDTLQCEGGAEKAVRARVSQAWLKWREISSLLCNPNVLITKRAMVYQACIRSVLLYAAETWPLTQRLTNMLQCCDRRMLRRMCGVSLADRVNSNEILERCKLVDVEVMLKKKRLFWFGHVKRRK